MQKEQSIEEINSKSYHNKELDILGCQHYSRNCKIKAACCGRVYVCRLCHNDDISNKHEINRHATKEIICMFCNLLQPVSNQCINESCSSFKDNIKFANYFCKVCVFFDNNKSKEIFHCDGCGICRIGKRENFKHCYRCNGCLALSTFDTHKCIENKFSDNCPVCLEDLFSSRDGSLSFDCGHQIHSTCYNEFIKSGSYKCPTCKKSIGKMHWERTDRVISRSKMPAMYDGSTVSILCNDCNEKSMDIPFHFVGSKCQKCGSYNTTTISKNIIVDETKDSSFTVVEDEEDEEDDDEDLSEDDGNDDEGENIVDENQDE